MLSFFDKLEFMLNERSKTKSELFEKGIDVEHIISIEFPIYVFFARLSKEKLPLEMIEKITRLSEKITPGFDFEGLIKSNFLFSISFTYPSLE